MTPARGPGQRRCALAVCAALAALALGLRLHALTAQGLWSDELFSVAAITQTGAGRPWYDYVPKNLPDLRMADSFLTWKAAENSPPLFEALLWLWGRCFGWSDLALRSFSALLDALAPLVLFAGLRRALGIWPAAAAGLLFALSPAAIAYAQEVRGYALLMLLASIAVVRLLRYALAQPARGGRRAHAGGFAADVAVYLLLAYTHYTGLVLACALAGLRFALACWQRRGLREFAWFAALPALLAPWLYLNWHAMAAAGSGRFGWIDLSWADVWSQLLPRAAQFLLPGPYTLPAVLALAWLAAWSATHKRAHSAAPDTAPGAAAQAAVAAERAAPGRERARRAPDTRWLLFCAFIALLAGHFGLGIYSAFSARAWNERYFSAMLPVLLTALALLFSLAWQPAPQALHRPQAPHASPRAAAGPRCWRRAARWFAPGALLLACAASAAGLRTAYHKPWKEEYREASRFIVQNTQGRATVAVTWASNAMYFNHYLRGFMADAGRDYVLTSVGQDGDLHAGLAALCQRSRSPGEQLVLFQHAMHRSYFELLNRACNGALRLVAEQRFRGLYVDLYEATGAAPAPLAR